MLFLATVPTDQLLRQCAQYKKLTQFLFITGRNRFTTDGEWLNNWFMITLQLLKLKIFYVKCALLSWECVPTIIDYWYGEEAAVLVKMAEQ